MRDENKFILSLIPRWICIAALLFACILIRADIKAIKQHIATHHTESINHTKESSRVLRKLEHYADRGDSNCFDCHYTEEG
jgi:hypothetical protein